MEWPDASNFACLIAGYYKLFVDPKRTIYFQTPGHSLLSKAGMLEIFYTVYTDCQFKLMSEFQIIIIIIIIGKAV